MGSTEKFCLRWNDFESNISVAFRDLREEKDFFDVTLACDDSQLQAHKVILSACSPFFRNILKRNPHQHPLLYLKGVKYAELEAVLNFMYMGEVNVAQEALNSFLSVAEELRVKGLTQNNTESATAKSDKPPRLRDQPPDREAGAPPAKKSRPSQPLQTAPLPAPPTSSSRLHHEASDDDIQEVVPVKAEPRDTPVVASQQAASNQYQEESSGTAVALQDNYQDDGYDYEGYSEGYDDSSYDQTLQAGPDGNKELIEAREAEIYANITKDPYKGFTCMICQFTASSRHKVFCHVESKHFKNSPILYPCAYCEKVLNSRNSLGVHKDHLEDARAAGSNTKHNGCN